MFYKTSSPAMTPIPVTARRALWVVTVLNPMVAAWMLAEGDWFDGYSRLTTVVTLGGHHQIVLGLAVGGFVALTVLASVTGGFGAATPVQRGLLAAAVAVSIVAAAGVLAVALLVGAGALVIAVVGWGLLRR